MASVPKPLPLASGASSFAPNALGSSEDENPTPHYQENPMPTQFHYNLYKLATPSFKQLFEDPDDAEATKNLEAINTLITIDNRLNGLCATRQHDFTILYHAIVAQIRAINQLKPSTLGNSRKTEEAIHTINYYIAEVVQQRHYPLSWKAKFSLGKHGKHVQVAFPSDEESNPFKSQAKGKAWWKQSTHTPQGGKNPDEGEVDITDYALQKSQPSPSQISEVQRLSQRLRAAIGRMKTIREEPETGG